MKLYCDEFPKSCEACPLYTRPVGGKNGKQKPGLCRVNNKRAPLPRQSCPLEGLPPRRAVYYQRPATDPAEAAGLMIAALVLGFLLLCVFFCFA